MKSFLKHAMAFACVMLFYSANLISQNVHLIISDAETGKPVSDVHVIVINSSIAATTNQNGEVFFEWDKIAGAELMLSHLTYELTTLQLDLINPIEQQIFLQAKNLALDEVTVVTKSSNIKAARLKQFNEDVFEQKKGIKKLAKEISIKNDFVILFQQMEDSLIAFSDDLIVFSNDYLGYNSLFYLEDYLNSNDHIFYKGKVSFTEYDRPNFAQKKRRKAIWKESFQHFLISALENDLERKKIRVYQDHPGLAENNYVGRPNILKKIVPTKIENVYALRMDKPFMVTQNGNRSIIETSNGVVLFNNQGVILNNNELNIYGYWGDLSLTEILPFDYFKGEARVDPYINSRRSYAITELKNPEKKKANALIQEIFIDTDKLFYAAGDKVLFNAHLFNHQTKNYTNNIELIYFDLISPEMKVIQSKTMLNAEASIMGSFELSKDFSEGQYIIRAYTDYQKKINKNIFNYTSICVGMIQDLTIDTNSPSDSIIVSLYPEGNKLIVGKNNNVLFTVKNEKGIAQDFVGLLHDNSDNTSVNLTSISQGIGTIDIIPKINSNYSITSINNNVPTKIVMNNLIDTTAMVQINSRDLEYVKLKIKSAKKDQNYHIKLFHRAKNIYEINPARPEISHRISKDFLPNDYLQISLFNEDGELVSERIFNNKIPHEKIVQVNPNYSFFYTGQEAQLSLLEDSLSASYVEDLIWDIKVVHEDFLGSRLTNEDHYIEDNLKLRSNADELTEKNIAYVNGLEQYPSSLHQDYNTIYEASKNEIIYEPQIYQSLSGNLIDPETKEGKKGIINITTLNPNLFYKEIYSDDTGAFLFDSLPFLDTAKFIIQARIDIPKGGGFTEGSRYVEIVLNDFEEKLELHPEDFNYYENVMIPDSGSLQAEYFSYDKVDYSMSQTIDPVTVTGSRSLYQALGNVYIIAEEPYIRPEWNVNRLMERLFTKQFRNDPKNPLRLQIWLADSRGVYRWFNTTLVVNGQVQNNMALLNNLTADNIISIGRSKTVISITTNPGYYSTQKMLEYKYGLIEHKFAGNIPPLKYQGRIHSTDPFAFKNDYRKTLCWESNLDLSSTKEKVISFKTSEIPGNYVVQLTCLHPIHGIITYEQIIEVKEVE